MEYNKLYVFESEAKKAVQELANEKGLVYGEINEEFEPVHIQPESEHEREKMLMNFFLYERKIWHFPCFELVDGEDVYRYAYLV